MFLNVLKYYLFNILCVFRLAQEGYTEVFVDQLTSVSIVLNISLELLST